MRIGVDGVCWTNRRGYGRFLRELVAALARVDRENRYVLFLDSGADRNQSWPPPFEPRYVATGVSTAEAARADGRRSIADLLRMSLAAAGESFDAFFFPSVYSYFPLIRPVRALVGVHDTIAERRPRQTFASPAQERAWRWKVRLALRQATRCLTVSEYSKGCIRRHYRFPSERIDVVPEAAARIFQPGDEPRDDFVLYAGGISPTKNLHTLIDAFARLRNRGRAERLVLVGDYEGDRFQTCYSELRSQIGALGLDGAVELPGYLPDEELAQLYRRARLFVMPSLDEGFGLPAIEAMACGAPVVVSSGNALEEVVGEAGLCVAPDDVEGLRLAMDRVLGDPELAARLAARGIERARAFSWESTARGVLRSLQATVLA